MTYSVHQHWDPLKVCAVGRSYPPEFYSFIKNSKARSVMERIAEETEEDYQSLIKLLNTFGVEVVRTEVNDDFDSYIGPDGKYVPPPMEPRDYTAMVGDTFYMPSPTIHSNWYELRGNDWPEHPTDKMPQWVLDELREIHGINSLSDIGQYIDHRNLKPIEELVKKQGNKIIYNADVNSAMTTRVGKDLFHGCHHDDLKCYLSDQQLNEQFSNYHNHKLNTIGHTDAVFCPVAPGLIVSLFDIPTYKDTFPDWEVVYLAGQSWDQVRPFLDLKEKNQGKFWVPGEEKNDEFTEYVNEWLDTWVGYVEETVFDVNMLVIDEKNVVVNGENDQVFNAFKRYGITPHVCNFRHRYFWDGGLHCITSDLHRQGQQQNYFPNRR
jgi:hypothetical protein